MSAPVNQAARLERQSPAVDFIDNRMHAYHRFFSNPPTIYDPVLRAYVPITLSNSTMQSQVAISSKSTLDARPVPPPSEAMLFWASIFPPAMSAITTWYPKEPNGSLEHGTSIRSSTNWSEVYLTLQSAQERFEQPKGFPGKLKRCFRKVVENTQPVQQIMPFIPDGAYTSPVLGALEIITVAAKRIIELRDDVSDSLENLERHFGDIETYLAMFPNDQNIISASIQMVSSTLKAVEEVISYFTMNAGLQAISPIIFALHIETKLISALFNGEEYQIALSESTKQIGASSQFLLTQARSSNMYQNRQTLEIAHNNSSTLVQVMDTQQQLADGQQQLADGQQQLADRHQQLADGHQKLADGQNEMMSLLEQLYHGVLHGFRQQQREMDQLRQQTLHMAAHVNTYQSHFTESFPNEQQAQVTYGGLLTLLNVPEIEISNFNHIIQYQHKIPADDRGRAERVLRTPQFASWASAPQSSELLVHGNFIGTLHLRLIPILLIAYFCGRHMDEGDASTGCRGMIQSLLSQLLRQNHLGMTLLARNASLNLVRYGDLKQLCALFGTLMHQLPLGVPPVFCIIDGIKYYEREQWLDDMVEVLRYLLDLRLDTSLRCIFKILITSPSETRMVRQAMQENCIISMASVPRTGQAYSQRGVARQVMNTLG
ncbi:Uu.00g035240.m01.CDS01 [Anthostomella pinea]|uniref:Uu.00g035240.m01.CDS01 n=1 Tax=Anthostomella pinea TaxID=933095 RepID=A0AAI8YDC5_9PEZI|nr:Uu.00g035240.m01.CDS01 [Anthostomella pinea]